MAWESHEQRLIDEYSALDTKVVALTQFIKANQIFAGLDQEEKGLMVSQLGHMKAYRGVLNKRIVKMTLKKHMPI